MKNLSLTFHYYRLILLYNIAFTVVGAVLIIGNGGFDPGGFFLAKLAGLVCAAGIYHYSAGNSYFYFRNAGLSIRRLWVYITLIDISIFLISATLITLIAHALAHFKG